MIQDVITLSSLVYALGALALMVPVLGTFVAKFLEKAENADDQNLLSFWGVFTKYRHVDFQGFLKSHREALQKGHETGDYVPGVCNYYRLMADMITRSSGPFWHFVPMTFGKSRKECHNQFHHTMVGALDAQKGDNILEIGCGFGEIGRQVACIASANVTGLTMADEEIVGGNERIRAAGLEKQCKMVQGNYHKLPFEDSTFNRVFGVYTLKYSSDLKLAISEATRVLKPGGRFVSYEIIVTDKYDKDDKQQLSYVQNISDSTCMPPLWHANDFRAAAKDAGLTLLSEEDLCEAENEGSWYSCFETTGIFAILETKAVHRLIALGEMIGVLPKAFGEFYEQHICHPTVDFVKAGRMGIVAGSVMMIWEKK